HGRGGGAGALDAQARAGRLHLDLRQAELGGHGGQAPRQLDEPIVAAAGGRSGRGAAPGHQPATATRPRYSPVRVSTFTTSPSLRKSGTSTVVGTPSMYRTSTSVFSLRYARASPTSSADSETCS